MTINRILLAALAAALLLGCGDEIEVNDLPGRVTSIGPVYVAAAPTGDAEALSIFFTTWDDEGDDLELVVERRLDGGAFEVVPAAELSPSDVSAVHTARREHTAQHLAWTYDGSVTASGAVELRISVAGYPDRGVVFGPFTVDGARP